MTSGYKMIDVSGYEIFLPAISAQLRGKEKSDSQLSETEFKSVVAITFRDAMNEFTCDSLLYRVDIPIDIFEGVDRYDIVAPTGFIVQDVVKIKEHKINVPNFHYDNDNLWLNCCPRKSVDNALYVEVALSPMRSAQQCKFPTEFLERYYDAIIANMYWRLANQTGRDWRSLGSADRYKNEYINKMNKAKRRHLSGGAPIRLKATRLTDDAIC